MRFELEIAPIDLDLTLGCGQTFRWERGLDGSWSGVLQDQAIRLRQIEGLIQAEATPGREDVSESILEFLRSQDDIARIQSKLRKDRVLAPGIKRMQGLRIVKLDEWECLISYVLATYANIPRIMKMVEALAANYGDPITRMRRSFPNRSQLSRAKAKDLAKLGLGYRAKYIEALCELFDDESLSTLSRVPYENLRRELVELPGVGNKVADCVSLFGFGRLESFPIDLWIERALKRLYRQTGTYNHLRGFAASRFGEYAGYAQEYLYHNERMRARNLGCAFSEE